MPGLTCGTAKHSPESHRAHAATVAVLRVDLDHLSRHAPVIGRMSVQCYHELSDESLPKMHTRFTQTYFRGTTISWLCLCVKFECVAHFVSMRVVWHAHFSWTSLRVPQHACVHQLDERRQHRIHACLGIMIRIFVQQRRQ